MEPDDYSCDIEPMGAIGEQGSLLLRVNRNCPWNRCLFCSLYKGRKFEYRTVEEIKHDIDVVKFLADERMFDLRYASLSNVCNWLASGGKHVFSRMPMP